MKKVLVTGGCGFIGSHFIRYLVENHRDLLVINIDKLTYAGSRENLKDIEGHDRYHFIHGDICDEDLVASILREGIHYVINFAAETHVDRSIISSRPFVETNVLGTQVLLDCSLKFGVEKYIQISTDEVYGSLPLGSGEPFTEETPLAPGNPYSASKAGADFLVMSYYRTHGLPAIITRCSNNYGEYQYPEKLIPKTILNALKDEPVEVYGDGLNVRDWIYVKDHCSAVFKAMERGVPGEVYNIGAGCEVSNIEIVKAILRILNKPDSLIQYVKDRPGHDRRYAMNSAKIRRELKWHPETDFMEGLMKTVRWYQQNEGRWK